MKRRPCQAACASERTTGLREVRIHERWELGMKERGTTGAEGPQIAGVPRVHRHQAGTQYSWTWHNWERHSPWSNQGSPQWNSPVDTTNNDPRQYGDGGGEVIPSFDGTDFRQYERRVRLFVSHTRLAPERRAGKLLERLEGRAFDLCEGIQDLETPEGVENLLDHLRTHFEPIEVSTRKDCRRLRLRFRASARCGNQGLRHEHFVETLQGSGWTSESLDEGTSVLEKGQFVS